MIRLTNKKLKELLQTVAELKTRKHIGLCWVSKIDGSYVCHESNMTKLPKSLFKWGITDQWQSSTNDKDGSANIGYNPVAKKWFGWSHRAIVGFGIGDKLFDENYKKATDDTPFIKYGGITIKTMKQAKQAATNFAQYIG